MSLKSDKDREKDKVNQERYQIILNSLLKDEENKYCADCDAKGPRWASWNLGVFLCIRCAGIHRNLGCHVSRIKSINLDTWKAEQLQLLQEIGNSRARAIYEASVPDTFRRPQTDSALESFIRAKYEHKKYMAKEWIPPSQAYLKAKAKDLEDGIEREIKDKKKKRTHAASASAGLGKVGLPKDQPRHHMSEVNHSVPTLFGLGKEIDLVNKSNAATPTQGTKQPQSQDLLLQIDQLSPQPKQHSKVDEFNDFLFAPILPEPMSGDCGNTAKPKISTIPFESFPTENNNNISILTNALTLDSSIFGSSTNGGNVNLLSTINPNPNSKEAILALYGNSIPTNQNFQSLGANNHHSITKDYAPFTTNNNNANRFQNTQFQQDYLKQVQNQLASLGVVNDASTKTPIPNDSLI